MCKRSFFILLLFPIQIAFSQQNLSYYLPQNISYDVAVPTPEKILGHAVGEWHVTHDQLVTYMRTLAETSDRIMLEETGRTYEDRPLLILTISSPENLSHIEDIRKEHVRLADPTEDADGAQDPPVVLYMGYSIHGNEPSGSNAALLFAYYLAAARGADIENLLSHSVILLDPSFNPDGLNRFASWVNSRKSAMVSADPNDMEHHEYWPGGRTNHYWFDLNRDWLPAQLPETQARLKVFHRWKPNILTDHHEMGTNGTFFFQPGIPSRNNPLTPEDTYRLTREIGKYHAKALDSIGSLYYSNESYDDYYLGKGSSYPDVNGAVGILFEQASSRGHAQESDNGVLTFPFTIRNQLTVSLSTLHAAVDLRVRLLKHQQEFYQHAVARAGKEPAPHYLIGSKERMKLFKLGQLISRHDIEVYHVSNSQQIDGIKYQPEELLAIPLEQAQYTLINALFETRTDFQDSLFYDVSTWTIPLAFNVHYRTGKAVTAAAFDPVADRPAGKVVHSQATYAFAFEWSQYLAPRCVYSLMNSGLTLRVAREPFVAAGHSFDRGSMVIPIRDQPLSADSLRQLVQLMASENAMNIYGIDSGLDYGSYSLGSPTFKSLTKPSIALLVEGRVRSYSAGEIWHLLDQTYKIPLTLLPVDVHGRADLSRYTTLIMPDGQYTGFTENSREKLNNWVRQGGTLIAFGDALPYLKATGFTTYGFIPQEKQKIAGDRPYNEYGNARGAQELGGAIFSVNLDLTHPLCFGYRQNTLPVFKNDRLFLKPSDNPYANPVRYTADPLLSGYVSAPVLAAMDRSSVAAITGVGDGKIIGFTNDLTFRAFWLGTQRLLMNAIFFGGQIGSGSDY